MDAAKATGERRGRLFAPLAGLRPKDLPRELLAGCVLAGLLVPQGLGYAGIAGVAVERGLYAAAVGLVVYAALGTSRQLVVSPTSSAAAMLAAAVAPLAVGDPARYGQLGAGLALGTGLLLILGSVLRLGFVSEFIAKPVLKGFMFGLAIRIIVKQVPTLLGIEGGKGSVFEQAGHVLSSLGSVHGTTLLVGTCALVLLLVLPRLTRAVPAALCALVSTLLAVRLFGLSEAGVAVLGNVPTGLPSPGLPGIGFGEADVLWAAGVGIAMIVYVESLGAGRTMAAKHGYEIVPNRELLALGGANVASGLLQGICVGGGLSASAANDAAGARSAASAICASGVIVLTLLFLMPVFALLPQAVLAAIVIEAVRRLVDAKELARYVRLRSGVLPHLTAAVGVLALGVLPGMLLAVLVSIVLLLRTLARPDVTELGRVRGQRHLAPLDGADGAERVPGLTVLRPEGQLFFGNVDRLRTRVRGIVTDPHPERQVLLNLSASPVLGVASLDALAQVHEDLERRGVELALARVTPAVRAFLARSGLLARIGEGRVFESQTVAVEAFLRRHGGAGGAPATSR
jgi:sulfate permease, SulP family